MIYLTVFFKKKLGFVSLMVLAFFACPQESFAMERDHHRSFDPLEQGRRAGQKIPRKFSTEGCQFTPHSLQLNKPIGMFIGLLLITSVRASQDSYISDQSDSVTSSFGPTCTTDLVCANQARALRFSQEAKGVTFPLFVQQYVHPGIYTRSTGVETIEKVIAKRSKDMNNAVQEGFRPNGMNAEEQRNFFYSRWRKLEQSYGDELRDDDAPDRTLAQKAYNYVTKTLFPKSVQKWQVSDLKMLNKLFVKSTGDFRDAPVSIRTTFYNVPEIFNTQQFREYLQVHSPLNLAGYEALARAVEAIFEPKSSLSEKWDNFIFENLEMGKKSPHYSFLKEYYGYNKLSLSEIRTKMDELVAKTKKLFEMDTVKAAAYFHMGLVNIHPWADGNGRVARTGLNLLLIKGGLPAIAFTSDARYTDAINSFNKGNETAFERYVQEEICRITGLYGNPEFAEGQPFETLLENCKIEDCEQEFKKLRTQFGL